MLGFTKIESLQKPKYPLATLWVLGTSTLIILLAILDSFLLHRSEVSSVISPLQRHDIQSCEMSYAYPMFFEVDRQKPESTLSKKYRLYLYREGDLDDPNRLYGIPALFIPGQAGSHKQIRSLASETTRLFHSSQAEQNLDFFTVGFNEELSALDGQTLLDQAEYTNKAIKLILSLYNSHSKPPTSVLIIGHSMGGIVARTSFMLPSYTPFSVSTIITLATPHISAPLLLDSRIYNVYKKMVQFWIDRQSTLLKHVTLISIAGGSLDNIVNSDTTNIEDFIPKTHGLTTYTTSIPGVWTSTDHMAILWCNQLIRVLASTLLQVASVRDDLEKRMAIFRQNLVDGEHSERFNHKKQEQKKFSTHSIKEEKIMSTQSNETKIMFDKREDFVLLLPTSPQKPFNFLTNIPPKYDSCWSLAICAAVDTSEHICENAAVKTYILPSAISAHLSKSTPYRLITIDPKYVSRNSYIGVAKTCSKYFSLDNSEEKALFVIAYSDQKQPKAHNNGVWDIIWSGLMFDVSFAQPLHAFPYLKNSLFAFDIQVISIKGNNDPLFPPMMKQTSNQHEIRFYRDLREGVSDRITFHQPTSANANGLLLEFFVDSQSLTVQIRLDWYGTLGRCVLRYGILVLHFFRVIACTVLCTQLYSYVQGKKDKRFEPIKLVILQCLSGPFLQLAHLILISGAFQCTLLSYIDNEISQKIYPALLIGANEWIMVGLVLFFFGLSVGFTVIIWSTICTVTSTLAYCCNLLPSIKLTLSLQQQTILFVAVTIGALKIVPPSVIIVGYILLWLFLTTVAKSNLNIYHYRQTWLLFLVSILPRHAPQVIVYVKNLLVGWTTITSASWQEVLTIALLVSLTTIGRTPTIFEQKRIAMPILCLFNVIIVYQILFGFAHPFILSHLDQ
ncbi:PGAP1-like protein-domain-containing protein [Choanephora cucurbitarum]|nr:PGAP1-like protein-domain-containing protein [Choanephora cucurbitarum]